MSTELLAYEAIFIVLLGVRPRQSSLIINDRQNGDCQVRRGKAIVVALNWRYDPQFADSLRTCVRRRQII
jgi:hypothetical protein